MLKKKPFSRKIWKTKIGYEFMEIQNILLSGVGGQGIILTANIISRVLFEKGFDVKKNEIHGMSQRGGDVTSHIRYGKEVFSPTIEESTADYLIAFEMVEALRMIKYLKPDGYCIINDLKIEPAPVLAGLQEYPDTDKIIQLFQDKTKHLYHLNAKQIADDIGNPRGINIVMLGVFSKLIDIPKEVWTDMIKKTVKPNFIEKNLLCFEAGRKI
jgi:indolepyruvate ferredoxin oxidoreductase, beta subunit